jgi:hypothetical protein
LAPPPVESEDPHPMQTTHSQSKPAFNGRSMLTSCSFPRAFEG